MSGLGGEQKFIKKGFPFDVGHCINPLFWRCRETLCNNSTCCVREGRLFSVLKNALFFFCVAAIIVFHFLHCFGVRVDYPSSEVRWQKNHAFPEILLKSVSTLTAQISCTEVRLGCFLSLRCCFRSLSSYWTMRLWGLATGKNCISQKAGKSVTPVGG